MDLKSLNIEVFDNLVTAAYDGTLVVIPLCDFNALKSSLTKVESELELLKSDNERLKNDLENVQCTLDRVQEQAESYKKEYLESINKLQTQEDLLKRKSQEMQSAMKEEYERGAFDGELKGILSERKKQEEKLKNNRKNRKKDCGRRADAEIVALAVKGMSIKEIINTRFTYNNKGYKKLYRGNKIYKAVSCKSDDDFKRIEVLFRDFPTVFDCSFEDVCNWYKSKNERRKNKKNESK